MKSCKELHWGKHYPWLQILDLAEAVFLVMCDPSMKEL
jgi:hypothetical protein